MAAPFMASASAAVVLGERPGHADANNGCHNDRGQRHGQPCALRPHHLYEPFPLKPRCAVRAPSVADYKHKTGWLAQFPQRKPVSDGTGSIGLFGMPPGTAGSL